MKNTLKNLLNCSKVILQTQFSILSVLLFSNKIGIRKIQSFSKRAIILGNGPSLANDKENIEEIKNQNSTDLWAVNFFANSDFFQTIKPTHYVVADPIFWRKDLNESQKTLLCKLLYNLNSKTDWRLILAIPYEAKNSFFISQISNKTISIIYYNRTPATGLSYVTRLLYDLQLAIVPAYNVLIATLTLAIPLKYEEIYIFGADHSWHEELRVTNNNETHVEQIHFYDKKSKPEPVHKDHSTTFDIGELFIRWGNVFKQYHTLAQYAQLHDVAIFNASSKTYIDAFERIPHDFISKKAAEPIITQK